MKIIDQKGSGRVLNMLHGWGMNARLFESWAEQLATNFEVNLIDLPGHGANQEHDLLDDLDCLAECCQALPRGLWLGWSLGGLLALNHALQVGSQVDALIMLCATPCFVKQECWEHGIDGHLLQRFGSDLQKDVKQTISSFLALEVMGVADERMLLRSLRKQVFSSPLPSLKSLKNGLKVLQSSDLSAALPNLEIPSLWLAGRRDRLVFPSAMQQAASLCGGDYHLIHGASHAPFLHCADELTAIIRQFCQRIN